MGTVIAVSVVNVNPNSRFNCSFQLQPLTVNCHL
jgi:hypothetical protein